VIGANDRINIGIVGLGGRGSSRINSGEISIGRNWGIFHLPMTQAYGKALLVTMSSRAWAAFALFPLKRFCMPVGDAF
jgi:hypothetical protein